MEFTRPRHETEQPIGQDVLVETKRSFVRSFIEITLTLVFWTYTLVVTWFFGSALFNQEGGLIASLKAMLNVTNRDIRELLGFGALALLISACALYVWRTYNKKRFGPLSRRKAPTDTTREDWLKLELIEPDEIERLQRDKVIVFEKNPVKELDQ